MHVQQVDQKRLYDSAHMSLFVCFFSLFNPGCQVTLCMVLARFDKN